MKLNHTDESAFNQTHFPLGCTGQGKEDVWVSGGNSSVNAGPVTGEV